MFIQKYTLCSLFIRNKISQKILIPIPFINCYLKTNNYRINLIGYLLLGLQNAFISGVQINLDINEWQLLISFTLDKIKAYLLPFYC